MSTGRLIVCPTPIGNLEDITLRVLSALREADLVACEDTRRTRVLLDRYGVGAKLVSYHEHNEAERASELVAKMNEGSVVALVSDAGMPLVSDPGFVLVRACVAAGLAVEVLPGPSAALSALVASALPAERWQFVGFLPRKRAELERVFAQPQTVVAFESPRRLGSSLTTLAALRPRPPRRRLPRADQAPRGGRARDRRRAGRALRRRCRPRARSSSSSARRPRPRPGSTLPWPPCAGSSTAGRQAAARRRRSWPS